MREFLSQTAPHLRRYAHALLGSWPVATGRLDLSRPRADQDADDLVQQVLLEFLRVGSTPIATGPVAKGGQIAQGPAACIGRERLRLTLYRNITALARKTLARETIDDRRILSEPCSADAAKTPVHFPWAPEARALPLLTFDLRAPLALVTLERLDYEQAAHALDMPVERVLPRLAVARARLASEISGQARAHLAAADFGPGADGPALPGGPATEGDLHRFVDHRLDRDRRLEIGLYLEARPDAKRRVNEWRRHGERLRRAFEPLMREPLPPTLNFFAPDPTVPAQYRSKERRRGIFAGLAALLTTPAGRATPAQWF